MKILFWLPAGFLPGIGGVETMSLSLATGLIQRGHTVCVIAFQPTTDFVSYTKMDNFEIFRFPSIQLANAKMQFETYRQIKQILITQNIDILHLHYAANANLAYYFLLQKYINIPQVMTVHGVLNELEYNLFKKISTQMQQIICVSQALKNQILTAFNGSHPFTLSVIYNALDINFNATFPSSPLTFLCLGRMTEEKGYDLAIQAFCLVQKQYTHIHLLLVGDGPELPRLKTLSSNSENICFYSGVPAEKRLNIITNSHVVLVPSYYESFGLVALEAGLLGRPVIASNMGGLTEIIEDETTGLLFPTGDINALAACMETLILNPTRITQMGENSASKLPAQFHYTTMLSQYQQAYEKSLPQRLS